MPRWVNHSAWQQPEREHATAIFGGPDDVDNGLCLCPLHHKLFYKGVLGIGDSHRILVSQRFVDRSPTAREHATALANRPLAGPQPSGAHPIAAAHHS